MISAPLSIHAQAIEKEWPVITRKGDALFEGGKPFRFIGIAAANLHQNEGQILPDFSNRFPDEYEIRDVLGAMRHLGARATRTFTLSVFSPEDDGAPVYIEGRRQYNEEALRCMDLVLALCHEYDVRVIIPLIAAQHFRYWHGVDEFSALAGKGPMTFWTDEDVKADYRHLFETLANRRNTVSGLLYKDDPAILAWQFGNEFNVYAPDNGKDGAVLMPMIGKWSSEMAAYFKSVDPKHLVMTAGYHLDSYLADPNIDVVSIHLYEHWNRLSGRSTDLAAIAAEEWAMCKGKKPLIVDEFGMGGTETMRKLMDEIRASGITGGLIWGIRGHRRDGGWYYHNEGGTVTNSYHIPGFATGRDFDERRILDLLRAEAYAISGLPVPPIAEPAQAPVLFALDGGLTWRGSTLAQYYVLQRSCSAKGPWVTVAAGLQDSVIGNVIAFEASGASNPGPIWFDENVMEGQPRFYRIKGANASGDGPWSPVFRWPDGE
jgi:hypothetical protein